MSNILESWALDRLTFTGRGAALCAPPLQRIMVRSSLRLLPARELRCETGGRRSRAQLVARVEHALGAVIGQCQRPEGLEEGEAREREVHNRGEPDRGSDAMAVRASQRVT